MGFKTKVIKNSILTRLGARESDSQIIKAKNTNRPSSSSNDSPIWKHLADLEHKVLDGNKIVQFNQGDLVNPGRMCGMSNPLL